MLAGAALAALALALPGCGGDSSPAGPAGADAAAAPAWSATSKRGEDGPTPAQRCRSQLGGFLAAMDRLRERLVVGVSYRQYIGELQAVRSYYEKLPIEELRAGCLSGAAATAERSFNTYLEAANAWSDCVEVPGCQAISIEGELQRRWRRGAKLLSGAESELSAD